MSLNLGKYLIKLRRNAKNIEKYDINGNKVTSLSGRYFKTCICFAISAIITYFLKKGFNQDFVSYVSSILSILIGLFITAIIFSFDKFYVKPEEDQLEEASSTEILLDTQSYNYSKQFAYLTGYNIVLCIFTILLLAFSTLFEDFMSVNLLDYEFKLNEINRDTICRFFQNSFVLLQRFYVLYWILNVVYNTLFIVTSMVDYMIIKIDRK